MMDEARIHCAGCVCWHRFKPTSTMGQCRISPPTIVNHACAWPVTDADMWCADGFDGVDTFSSNLARLASAKRPFANVDMDAIQRAFGAGGGGGGGLSDLMTVIYKKPDDWAPEPSEESDWDRNADNPAARVIRVHCDEWAESTSPLMGQGCPIAEEGGAASCLSSGSACGGWKGQRHIDGVGECILCIPPD
jgi:hypothetical protein